MFVEASDDLGSGIRLSRRRQQLGSLQHRSIQPACSSGTNHISVAGFTGRLAGQAHTWKRVKLVIRESVHELLDSQSCLFMASSFNKSASAGLGTLGCGVFWPAGFTAILAALQDPFDSLELLLEPPFVCDGLALGQVLLREHLGP